MADRFTLVAKAGDVPEGGALCVTVGDRKIALFKIDGEIHALDNICPHQGGPLADGWVSDGFVTCPLHGWDYDIRSGRADNGTDAATVVPVRLEGEDVSVDAGPPDAADEVRK